MEDSNEYLQTIGELDDVFDGDKEEYKKYLMEQISCAEQLNKFYGSKDYKPFKTDLFYRQLEYLESFMNNENNIDKSVVYDSVNNPYHYASGKYECIEVMRDTFGDEMLKSFCLLNAFKYLYRHHKKNGVEDLKKARFYLDYVIEKLS
jgi:hypothetical protein